MQDECVILDYAAGAADGFGLSSGEGWSDGQTFACGFRPAARDEALDDSEVTRLDAVLRLPLAAEPYIANVDRIKVTKRYGLAYTTPPVFEIVGAVERGPSGLQLKLANVTDGTDE